MSGSLMMGVRRAPSRRGLLMRTALRQKRYGEHPCPCARPVAITVEQSNKRRLLVHPHRHERRRRLVGRLEEATRDEVDDLGRFDTLLNTINLYKTPTPERKVITQPNERVIPRGPQNAAELILGHRNEEIALGPAR